MTDKNTLGLARQWASDIDADRETLSQDTIDAAADLISSLPDAWVDAEKLREVVADHHIDMSEELVEALGALLPAPPAPRTMDEIEWDDDEHHLAEATAAWTEGHPSNVVMLNKFGKKITVYQSAPHYSGLRELNPGILTPTGRKYRLEPEDDTPTSPIEDKPAPEPAAPRPEDVPEFDPAYTYRDKDGDTWEFLNHNWRWLDYGRDATNYLTPPAKYGPYTRIEARSKRPATTTGISDD